MNANRDITIHQLETQKFHQVPQLFTRSIEHRWDAEKKCLIEIHYTSPYVKLSSDAKLAYGIFLNRCQLSIRSYQQGNCDYVDEHDAVFMIYTVSDLMKVLDKSKNTVIKIKKELTNLGLLREVRLGKNKPNRLYLQNVDATSQLTEYYDENDTLLKRLDYFGNILYENDSAKSLDIKGSSNNEPREVQKLNPSNTNTSKTDIENNIISSRKVEKIRQNFSQPAGADHHSSQEQSVKYVPPKYYSLLNVIADRYNAKFTQYDLFTGEFQNYSLTHPQKMLIGQYLAEGYVTSQELTDLIENHVPVDCDSPLAYLLKSLENLKRERLYEQKEIAHRNAENYYAMRQQGVVADER